MDLKKFIGRERKRLGGEGKEMEVTGDDSVETEDPHEWSAYTVATFVRSYIVPKSHFTPSHSYSIIYHGTGP